MEELKCPACGAPIKGQITSRIVMCEYCETQFVLDADMADAVMDTAEVDEYAEYYGQWESMAHFAADACSEFLEGLDDDYFVVNDKIFDGLGIDEDEEVYLIHDDSMFGRGKNGFAITEHGLLCRDMGASSVTFFDWPTFSQYDQPYADGSNIAVNGYNICYYTNDSDLIPYLLGLYDMLHDACPYLAEDEEDED